jgi:hypothetical protein
LEGNTKKRRYREGDFSASDSIIAMALFLAVAQIYPVGEAET